MQTIHANASPRQQKKTSAFVTRVHRSSHLGKFVVPQRGRDIFTTVMGDFFSAGQPRPSPLFVGKRQRPCHLRSPAYKAYALLRFVAEDFLDLRRKIESEFLWLGRNFRINQEIHLTSFSLVHTSELLPKNTKVKSTSGRPHWSRRDHKVPKEPWWHYLLSCFVYLLFFTILT